MKIYLAIKFHFDNKNRPLIEEICKHLLNLGHTTTCAVRDFEVWGDRRFEPQQLLTKAFDAIEGSDLLLLEVSEKGMGLGIEAGFAFARNKPIVTIAQRGSDISSNLKSISSKLILYSRVDEVMI